MSYIVFARKYRPQDFDDVIGQSHVTTTLKNAIMQSRVAHAYLFTGPRGTGKTTTARIFAKALNCEKGPRPSPCNTCPSCLEITKGSSLDILEIDGASTRGIEEIRSLRENAKFAPSKGRFKVYIIDEVHMLTPEAFNALLKTLEEPPPHIKFIFATTSPHKVPATILSRCQRFDFRRIAIKEIIGSLRKIAAAEKLNVNDEALALIARYGDGSMRDSQVILDQIASFGRGTIALDDVVRILGVVEDEVLFALSEAIKARDPKAGIMIIDALINEGKDSMQVALGLIEHFRNICVVKISKELHTLLDAGPEKVRRYEAQAEAFTVDEILYIVYTLSNTLDFIRRSNLSRIPLEAAVVKLAQAARALPLSEILSRLEVLEGQTRKTSPKIAGDNPVRTPPGPSQEPKPRQESGPRQEHRPPTQEPPAPPQGPRQQPEIHSKVQTAVAEEHLPLDLDEIAGCWAKVISYIRPRKISIASYLEEGYPSALNSNVLSIGFPKACSFHKEVLDSIDNRRIIEESLREICGIELKVELTISEPATGKAGRLSTAGEGGGELDTTTDDTDPIVKAAMNIFGGKAAGVDDGKGIVR